jgi:hypothetical protein
MPQNWRMASSEIVLGMPERAQMQRVNLLGKLTLDKRSSSLPAAEEVKIEEGETRRSAKQPATQSRALFWLSAQPRVLSIQCYASGVRRRTTKTA